MEREERREDDCKHPRRGETNWLATAVPCCLWAGREKSKKACGGKSVGDVFFFSLIFFFLSHFFLIDPTAAAARFKALLVRGGDSEGKKPSLQRHAKVWQIPGFGTESIGARACPANQLEWRLLSTAIGTVSEQPVTDAGQR